MDQCLPQYADGWPTVVADPPWSFNDKGSRVAPDQDGKAGGYQTMYLDAICALPVGAVAARDSLLFLWTTSAHLLDGSAARVCAAWGFEPKTTMVWVKARQRTVREEAPITDLDSLGLPRVLSWPVLQIGCGHYTRAAHELVVIARRGKARVQVRNVPSVFFAPRTRHSAKPELFQDLVERLSPGPYLELFARRERPGWTCWGNQCPQSVSPTGQVVGLP
jgi:N6-adenosine-specific RNA methylase IME4